MLYRQKRSNLINNLSAVSNAAKRGIMKADTDKLYKMQILMGFYINHLR